MKHLSIFLLLVSFLIISCVITENEFIEEVVNEGSIVPEELVDETIPIPQLARPDTIVITELVPVVPDLVEEIPVESNPVIPEPITKPEPKKEVYVPPVPISNPDPIPVFFPPIPELEPNTIVKLVLDNYTFSASTKFSQVLKFTKGLSYHTTVREGSSFRVRVRFEGIVPDEGGCTLTASDTNGYTATKQANANGYDATVVFSTEHDNAYDSDRYVEVTIQSCNLPGLVFEIDEDNNSVRVEVITAGTIENPDTDTYIFTVDSLEFVDLGKEDRSCREMDLTWTLISDIETPSNEYFGSVQGVTVWFKITDTQPDLYGNTVHEDSWKFDGGVTEYEFGRCYDYTVPDTTRTITFTLKRISRAPIYCAPDCGDSFYYYPPGGTYRVGTPSSTSVTVN